MDKIKYFVRTSKPKRSEPSRARFKEVWGGFWQFSSTHGFNFAYSVKGELINTLSSHVRKFKCCVFVVFNE